MSTSEFPSSLEDLLPPAQLVPPETVAPAKPAKKTRTVTRTKAPKEPKAPKTPKVPKVPRGAAPAAPAPKRPSRKTDVIIGAQPRVDLLPPEIKAKRDSAGMRRLLVLVVIAVVLIAIAGSLGARVWSQSAAAEQRAEQDRAATLLTQQRSYNDVVKTQSDIALAQAAQRVGASTEVDWKGYLDQVQATLPANVAIKTIAVDSSSPTAAYAQPTAPLQGARVATITFSATSPDIPRVPEWLTALSKLPGYADANPGSVSYDEASKIYTASVTMHVNSAVFDQRFTKEK
jgi:type II secretory pathway pseudopilin PulG